MTIFSQYNVVRETKTLLENVVHPPIDEQNAYLQIKFINVCRALRV